MTRPYHTVRPWVQLLLPLDPPRFDARTYLVTASPRFARRKGRP